MRQRWEVLQTGERHSTVRNGKQAAKPEPKSNSTPDGSRHPMTPAEMTQVSQGLGDLTNIMWDLIQSYRIPPNQKGELSFIALQGEAEIIIIYQQKNII